MESRGCGVIAFTAVSGLIIRPDILPRRNKIKKPRTRRGKVKSYVSGIYEPSSMMMSVSRIPFESVYSSIFGKNAPSR